MKIIAQFIRDENGATAIEYGLLIGLISVAIVASVTAVGTSLVDIFEVLSAKFTSLA